MTWIKVCGITSPSDADAAVAAGVSAIGLVLARSPRRVSLDAARRIADRVRGRVEIVGVFKEPEDMASAHEAIRFDRVQLHNLASPDIDVPVLRALAPEALGTYEPIEGETLVIDGSEGQGVSPDWMRLRTHPMARLVVAGGLTPKTVGAVVEGLRPYGVDVSSGVELAPGHKDSVLMARFVAAVRSADACR
jgi:phosphoribosylanthranilate isomerase